MELTAALNSIAGTTGLEAQGAANVIAGTTDRDLVAALNIVAGNTTYIELQGVLNQLAGSSGLGVNAAATLARSAVSTSVTAQPCPLTPMAATAPACPAVTCRVTSTTPCHQSAGFCSAQPGRGRWVG